MESRTRNPRRLDQRLRLTIKNKFIAMAGLMALIIVSLVLIERYNTHLLGGLDQIRVEMAEAKAGMLMLRRNEKDFLARKDLKYRQRFDENHRSLQDRLTRIGRAIEDEGLDLQGLDDLKTDLGRYASTFTAVVDKSREIGLSPTEGLYGNLRRAVHTVEGRIASRDDQRLRADMLELRRNEKDFMLRANMKYVSHFATNHQRLLNDLDASNHHASFKEAIRRFIGEYHKDFLALVEANRAIGLTPEQGLMGRMRDSVHRTEGLFKDMSGRLDEIIARKSSQRSLVTSTLSIVSLAVCIILLAGFSRSITRPIQRLSDTMAAIASSNDLRLRADPESEDEIGVMARNFNAMIVKFKALNERVGETSHRLAIASGDLSSITEQTNQCIHEQQSRTEQVAQAINGMSDTAHEVSRNIGQTAQAVADADREATTGQQTVGKAIEAIEKLAIRVEEAASVVHRLEQDSANIDTVLDVIQGVAEQTNLLALNAAIEAARAGEQGRGFAVVADEVRTLAGRTQESTEEIKQVIDRLQTGSRKAVEVMGRSRDEARSVVEQATGAGHSLTTISEAISRINEMSTQIACAAEEQSASAEDIDRSIAGINELASETSNRAELTATASEDLSRLAEELKGMVAQFRV